MATRAGISRSARGDEDGQVIVGGIDATIDGQEVGLMVLMRRELGDVLREHRQARGLTLRGLSALAAVSPGYLSEIERGTKEASSELLASVCAALGVPLSDVLATLSVRVAEVEALTSPVLVPMPAPLAPVSASAA
jgi:predicted transcriptional regulator